MSNTEETQNHQNTATPHTIGRGMLIAAWITALLLLTLYFSNWEEQRHNPNQVPIAQVNQDGSREVRLTRNRYGHYVATGYINGKAVQFFLDTGATNVVIPEGVANNLGLPKLATHKAQTANGTVDIFVTQLDNLTLGNIRFFDVDASINPHMEGDEILLGMSALRQLDFSQQGDQLILKLPQQN
ncbi:TIGR02281 family clan AA aspartic protease [Endozoicomonas sp. SM1973]|uniref:TIGR02281 family clan AA aspartic protease n=1 Tax=Spartinivicinus marinus TaxID=2994442 RepID=A0A853I4P7_9GAMM|nr:TIGR02281 family clan AA aspartic protease [Spartinivicinus marinus]MCX4028343.1 TIGR02281 family clan AA aspartic protease [Spartinivicinus marinus]NYZ65678.1 TIGR02281 family clan AA aspartic protease [Spartinivicinus marinus]